MTSDFEAVTLRGAALRRWENYGAKHEYDAETGTLTLKFSEGWVDGMSFDDVSFVRETWCIDDPTFNVEYRCELVVDEIYRFDVKMMIHNVSKNASSSWFDISTPFNDTGYIRHVRTGSKVQIKIYAVVDVKSQGKKRKTALTFANGYFVATDRLDALGPNSPGKMFSLSDVMFLFVHWAGKDTLSQICLRCNLSDCPL